MGVDGFRFDLASIFTRNEEGGVNLEDPPIISEISGDPALEYAWLIAEPWQGEPGSGYMMGRAFPGKTWRQWNDHYRDTVRDFVRGQEGLVPALYGPPLRQHRSVAGYQDGGLPALPER